MQNAFGPIELTVVREFHATLDSLDIRLSSGTTVDLASIALDLTGDFDGVLLQAVINWSAFFDNASQPDLSGSASITFELLRDSEVIYRVDQTAVQNAASVIKTSGRTNKVATLLHLDIAPLTGLTGQVAYTLRATNISLVPPAGVGDDVGSVSADIGAVTFVVQEVEGNSRQQKSIFSGVERVFVAESAAPLQLPPATFPVPLPEGGTIELATVGINLGTDMDGILLLGTVNWSATFDYTPAIGGTVTIIRPDVITVTFELLRDGEIIYRITQSATQSIVPFTPTNRRFIRTTYEIAALLHFDLSALTQVPGFVTYTLRATNISVTPAIFVFSGTAPTVAITSAAGPVTLVAKEIEAHIHKRAGGEDHD